MKNTEQSKAKQMERFLRDECHEQRPLLLVLLGLQRLCIDGFLHAVPLVPLPLRLDSSPLNVSTDVTQIRHTLVASERPFLDIPVDERTPDDDEAVAEGQVERDFVEAGDEPSSLVQGVVCGRLVEFVLGEEVKLVGVEERKRDLCGEFGGECDCEEYDGKGRRRDESNNHVCCNKVWVRRKAEMNGGDKRERGGLLGVN